MNKNTVCAKYKKNNSDNSFYFVNPSNDLTTEIRDINDNKIELYKEILNAKCLNVVDGFVDELGIKEKILVYTNKIFLLQKELFKNYKNSPINVEHKKLNISSKKVMKSLFKKKIDEINRYLETVDNVIFNVEVDWSDEFNIRKKIDLYSDNSCNKKDDDKNNSPSNINICANPNTNDKDNEISESNLLEKTIDVKISKKVEWDDNAVKIALKNKFFSQQEFLKDAKDMTPNQISEKINNLVYQVENINGYINGLNVLYNVVSKAKINVPDLKVYKLLELLKNNCKTAKKITSSFDNFLKYKTKSDFEIISKIYEKNNKNKLLDELNDEIIESKIAFDNLMQEYTLIQLIARRTYVKDIKKEISSTKSQKIKYFENQLETNSVSLIANVENVKNWRKLFVNDSLSILKKSLKKLKRNKNLIDEIFRVLNIHIGIIYDLKILISLLNKQFKKDIKHGILEYQTSYPLVEQFVNEQSIIIKEMASEKLILEVISYHFRLVLLIEKMIEQKFKKLKLNFINEYQNWIDEKCLLLDKNEKLINIKEKISKNSNLVSENDIVDPETNNIKKAPVRSTKKSEPKNNKENLRLVKKKATNADKTIKKRLEQIIDNK